MGEEITYRGYKIIGESYQNDEGKWIPKARIIPETDSMNEEEGPMEWPELFNTQTEADDFALDGAQLYIDEND